MSEYKPRVKFGIKKYKFPKGNVSFSIGLAKENYGEFTERYLMISLGKIGLTIGWIIE